MTDAAYIAARLGRAMPRDKRLKFALYMVNLIAMTEAGLNASAARIAAQVAAKASQIKSTKDLDPALQVSLKRWLQPLSDAHIQAAASEWDTLSNSK